MPSDSGIVVIAYDVPLARDRIMQMVARRPEYEVVGEASDGTEAVDRILETDPDVVFLDIRMPGLNGIEVAQALDADDRAPPSIVFVTAHDEFAAAAFDVSAIDYVLKPVERERFERSLQRVEARRASAAGTPGLDPDLRAVLERLTAQQGYASRFLVRAAKGYYFVRADEVEWVDAQGNYMRLHTPGRSHMVRATMKSFIHQLDPERFVRVHRSAIVAVDCIERIEPHEHGEYRLTLRDGTRLTSSRAHSAALRRLLR
jgi:two-component system LytT family response regulator